MGSIFGDSHDITFGSESAPKKENLLVPKSETRAVRDFRETPPVSARTPAGRPQAPRSGVSPDISERPRAPRPRPMADIGSPVPTRPSLVRLVESMKPSFLPIAEANILRLVSLSPSEQTDPMMLARLAETTLIFGTGFSTLQNTGTTYTAFPDMRLAYNEKDRLAGWIIFRPVTEMKAFQMMLEALGFPHVYGTRDVIANIRESITDTAFLDKCRFFELFPTLTDERKIGEFTLKNTSTGLQVGSSQTHITLGYFPADTTSLEDGSDLLLTQTADSYHFASVDLNWTQGEIIEITGNAAKKHHLKFTFDTFYIDANSVGVALGYALKDRQELATNGVLTFVVEEDRATRSILGHIFIDSRGFVHSYEMMGVHKEILKGIRKTYEAEIMKNPRIERSELVHTLRRELTKYCFLMTGRTPVVMPVIIER